MRVNNISFKAGNRSILSNLSFELRTGEITVVLGPNGAGKSTLLRLLAGEMKPHSGDIYFDNQPMHKISPAALARQRAVLTQQYAISLPFICEEVVMMGRYPHFSNIPTAQDADIVTAAMDDMEVTHLRSRPFQTLSGGEQQRVQVARVLAQLWNPTNDNKYKLLLLDEPTSSMDILHQQMLLTKARQLAQQQYAVLLVLHDLNLAAQFAHHILLLQNGKLLADGSASEVLQPHTIQKAYGIEVSILQSEAHDHPIIVPVSKVNTPLCLP